VATDDLLLTLGGEAAQRARERPVVDVAESLVFVERVDRHESRSAQVAAELGASARFVTHLVTLQHRPRVRRVAARTALIAPFAFQCTVFL